jgi:hypothetical protein
LDFVRFFRVTLTSKERSLAYVAMIDAVAAAFVFVLEPLDRKG